MCDLYKRIEELCNGKGITGYRLCKDLGYQPSILTELKMGRVKTLSSAKLNEIANYFGVSVDYLMNGENDADELAEYIAMLRTRPECRMLLDTVKGSKKSEVEENVRFIEAMRKAKNAD